MKSEGVLAPETFWNHFWCHLDNSGRHIGVGGAEEIPKMEPFGATLVSAGATGNSQNGAFGPPHARKNKKKEVQRGMAKTTMTFERF